MPQTILIVDDDADVRMVAQVALTGLGYVTIETGDPQKAIWIVKERSVDLLLTDVVMPLMKGTELADRVQEASPSTKILLMSGYQTADIAPSGRAFLAKPFSIDGLAKRVRETLARPSAFARRAASPEPPPHSST
ncbi:MAG TPA: response regulator [Methylomirabilota bacterium]|nr:response regulator [Methylomirabilota bacterium]